MTHEFENRGKRTFRQRLGNLVTKSGYKIEGHDKENTNPEHELGSSLFLTAANTINQFFQIEQALEIPTESINFFQTRVAVALAIVVTENSKFKNEGGFDITIRPVKLAEYKKFASKHYSNPDINDQKKGAYEREIDLATLHCIKRIWLGEIHPKYKIRLLSHLTDSRPYHYDISKEKGNDLTSYRQKFAEDLVVKNFKERISRLYAEWQQSQ